MKALLVSLMLYFGLLRSLQAQIWQEGHYYDKRGGKHEGLIKHFSRSDWGSGADNFIHFKDSLKAEKEKLTIQDVSSFVVEGDSFAIVKNFEINTMAWYSADFAKVIVPGKITLFEHYTTGGTGAYLSTFTTLLIRKGHNVLRIKNNKEFRNVSAQLMSDDPDLVAKIAKKKYRLSNIEEVVRMYNSRFAVE